MSQQLHSGGGPCRTRCWSNVEKLLKCVRATLQPTPGHQGFGLLKKAWIALSCDKGSVVLGKKGLRGMASDVGRFTRGVERSEGFCGKAKRDVTASTAKHLCQRLEVKLPQCKVMRLSQGRQRFHLAAGF